jgi:ribosomal protein S18 acetylase RimI-like enzyme
MPLAFRLATPADYDAVGRMVIDSFEPITWFRRVDEIYGPLNGKRWRERWELRMAAVFATQRVLLGEHLGRTVAFASGTLDPATQLGFVDLIAVDRRCQGRGFGREMLRGMLAYFKEQGAEHVHLDCLADNDAGNRLYRSEGFQEVARSIRWFRKI